MKKKTYLWMLSMTCCARHDDDGNNDEVWEDDLNSAQLAYAIQLVRPFLYRSLASSVIPHWLTVYQGGDLIKGHQPVTT